jgi:hypothetical protein
MYCTYKILNSGWNKRTEERKERRESMRKRRGEK